jgi:hypothetical protein
MQNMQGFNTNLGKWAFAAIGGTVVLATLAPVKNAQSLAASPTEKTVDEKAHERASMIEVFPSSSAFFVHNSLELWARHRSCFILAQRIQDWLNTQGCSEHPDKLFRNWLLFVFLTDSLVLSAGYRSGS